MPQQQRLSNDEFFTQLTSLLSSTHASQHGSIFLTQKSLPPQPSTTSNTTTPPTETPSQILIRATNGATQPTKSTATATSKIPASKITEKHSPKEKIKIATVVDVAALDDFYIKYAEVCKKGMEGLRKRDKKKAKAKKKGKKGGAGA